MSLRGGSGSEGRGNPTACNGHVRIIPFAHWITVDRHGLRPRDDKEWKENSSEHNLSLRGESGSETTRQSIECNGRRTDMYGSLTGSQWIATGFRPRDGQGMERNGSDAQLCHCEEGTQVRGRGNPLYAMGAYGEYETVLGSQWIARGFQPSR